MSGICGCGEEIGADDKYVYRIETVNEYGEPEIHYLSEPDAESYCSTTTKVIKMRQSRYNSILSSLAGGKFTDPEFPPNEASLGRFKGKESKIQWKRVTEFIENPVLFEKSVSPTDILQGNVGDCYLMSVLASLAESPYMIKRLFNRFDIEKGIYSIQFKNQGVPQQMIVDDYIPVYHNKPVFSKPAEFSKQVWVLIIEKAWAKFCGSYEGISSGYPSLVLDVFGEGAVYYCDTDYPEIQQEIEYAARSEFPTCLCSKFDEKALLDKGLVVGHSYTLLDSTLLKGDRLLKLRNPWGRGEWKGQYSDKDPVWKTLSAAEEKQLKILKKEDGIFYFPFSRLQEYFDSLVYCQTIKGYNYEYNILPITTGRGSYFYFDLEKDSEVCINIHTKKQGKLTALCARVVSHSGEEEDYYFIEEVIDSDFGNLTINPYRGNAWEAGRHYFYLKHEGQANSTVTEAIVGIYSNLSVQLHMVDPQSMKKRGFLAKTLESLAETVYPDLRTVDPRSYKVCSFLNPLGFGIIVVRVGKDSKPIKVQFDSADFEEMGLTLKRPFKRAGEVKQDVQPGKTMLVVCRRKWEQQSSQREIVFPPRLKIHEAII